MSGVITVKLGGQKRSLKFGTNSTARYCEIRKCSLDDYIKDMDFDNLKAGVVRDLIYSALWAYNVTNNIETDFNTFNVGDWIDEADKDEVNNIFLEMASSSTQKVKVKKVGDGSKKKLHGIAH